MIKALINQFAENTYIIKDGKEAVIIDPGAPIDMIKEFIEEQQIVVKAVLLTHGHIDHILSLNHVLDEYKDVFAYIHEKERDFLFDPNLNLSSTTYNRLVLNDKSRVKTFKDGEVFKLKYQDIEITHNPGHTRGSSSFKYKNSLFCGDTIFDNNPFC